jgi:hypothetical protein
VISDFRRDLDVVCSTNVSGSVPKRRSAITTVRYVISQNSADLNITILLIDL